ncbi:GntR family transcriptional regulator [Lactiplantibacillus garii]|uniref:GntR family transcriptional regulator n=1 Tax=Lactiplantibacillus garii TaxID=2306423 RepID=A0A3R8J7X3_9LACO|nr:GntR family transcriptional regulator [Lactiplantibacillus garii]RRK10947.1 GntR family transcriptional regulator [Lactiplantibacillus garii]
MAYKYETIADSLRRDIKSGKYTPGELMPDQNKLAAKFDTTRITIHKAIQLLIIEGMVYSKRGAGTFVRKDFGVKEQRQETLVDRPLGTTRTHQGKKVTSKVLELEARLPTKREAEQLMIDEMDPVYVIRRTRFVEDKVWAYEHTIMPTGLVTLTKKVLEGSIYGYIEKENGMTIAGSHRIISAAKATEEDVEAMGATLNDPVLVINQVSYMDDGQPFEVSESHFPYATSTVVADIQVH